MGIENDDIDDGLTPEERAALAEDDGDEGATNQGDGDAGNENDAGGDGQDGATGADDESGTRGDAGAPDAADAADGGQPAVDGAEKPQMAAQQSGPVLIAEAPEDADAKLADIAGKKGDLLTKFDDGDITAKEYQAELDALNKQEREIERAVEKAQLAAEMEAQRQKNEWLATVNSFIAANEVYSPDKNPRLYRMLDQEVRDVAVSEEGKAMTGTQILARAHQNLIEAGIVSAKKADAPAGDGKPARQAAPARELPPSLHAVPAADVDDVAGGKWAALDRLPPHQLEAALAKLSDADREAYLASA